MFSWTTTQCKHWCNRFLLVLFSKLRESQKVLVQKFIFQFKGHFNTEVPSVHAVMKGFFLIIAYFKINVIMGKITNI